MTNIGGQIKKELSELIREGYDILIAEAEEKSKKEVKKKKRMILKSRCQQSCDINLGIQKLFQLLDN